MQEYRLNENGVILTTPVKAVVPIIKGVGDFCNLRCGYCFNNPKEQSLACLMSDELLEKLLREYMDLFNGKLRFIWHGGEPLLAGPSFFQKVVKLQQRFLRPGQQIQNALQTNATIINHDWAKFLKNNNFGVGISLDGGRESHNRFRVDHAGIGSFDRTVRGIRILRSYGFKPSVIQTLTKSNLPNINKDFDFFTKVLDIKEWGINEYLDISGSNRVMLTQSLSNQELAAAFIRYFELWLKQNDKTLRIREIDNFIAGVRKRRPPNCSFNGGCTSHFCVEYDGKVYPCDRLSGHEAFLLGDLSKQSLKDILNSHARLNCAEANSKLPRDCIKCEWQYACHNGCTNHRKDGKYYYCEARKEFFAYTRGKLAEYGMLS